MTKDPRGSLAVIVTGIIVILVALLLTLGEAMAAGVFR